MIQALGLSKLKGTLPAGAPGAAHSGFSCPDPGGTPRACTPKPLPTPPPSRRRLATLPRRESWGCLASSHLGLQGHPGPRGRPGPKGSKGDEVRGPAVHREGKETVPGTQHTGGRAGGAVRKRGNHREGPCRVWPGQDPFKQPEGGGMTSPIYRASRRETTCQVSQRYLNPGLSRSNAGLSFHHATLWKEKTGRSEARGCGG